MQRIITLILIIVSTHIMAQVSYQQDVIVGDTTGQSCSDCALNVASTDKVMRIPNLSTAARDAIAAPIEGMLIYNSEDRELQGYAMGETDILLPDTRSQASGSSSFTSVGITYTPAADTELSAISIGYATISGSGNHRLIISETRPCNGAARAPLKSGGTLCYTDEIAPTANALNTYPIASPVSLTAGTKYYIYSDPTYGVTPQVKPSNNNHPEIGYLNRASISCTETGNDFDIQLHIRGIGIGWTTIKK